MVLGCRTWCWGLDGAGVPHMVLGADGAGGLMVLECRTWCWGLDGAGGLMVLGA